MATNTPSNILGYLPTRWEDCIGNSKIKYTFQGLLKQIRLQGKRKAGRFFIHGASRCGKTALTKLFAQSLLCEQLGKQTLNPCGVCNPCRTDAATLGERGLEVHLRNGKAHYLPLDATKITSTKELIELLTELRSYDGTRLVTIDEVHRLQHRDMDEQLLKPLEERDFLWIVMSAYPDKLEPMFMKRFVKLGTQSPTESELAIYLQDRCEEAGINHEPAALLRLVDLSECVPGVALQAIDFASLDPETGLTLQLVEEFEFEIAC